MKITLVNTTDKIGGAAVACNRLMQALNNSGVAAKMLVQTKTRDDLLVETTTTNNVKKAINFYRFAYERLVFTLYEKSKDLRFAFSLGNTGEDITKHQLIQNADLINLHFTSFGFLSLQSLKQIVALKKPLVWTLHDMWAFTGGCHYTGDCTAFETQCMKCPFLRKPAENDLSHKIWQKKRKLFHEANISFVASSQWLAETAKRSSLLRNFRIESIGIPIDTQEYKPMNQQDARITHKLPNDKQLILFAAMNIADRRKGYNYFVEAMQIMKKQHPETADKVELVVFGKSTAEALELLPFKTHNLTFLQTDLQIAEAFNAVDLFAIPSLQDNLPNIIMESLACGVPVVTVRGKYRCGSGAA